MGRQDRACAEIQTGEARQAKGKYHEEEKGQEAEQTKKGSKERTCDSWILSTEFSI